MDCKEIIEKYLKDNDYDGLYLAGECGCALDDIIPCDSFCSACEPGYKVKPDNEDPEYGDHDWIISSNKTGRIGKDA